MAERGPRRPRRPLPAPPPRARVGLLDQITATSLDEDYAHVSSRRAQSRRDQVQPEGEEPPGRRLGGPGPVALVVLAVFGVLVATAAVQTSRDADESASSRASLVSQVNERRAGLAQRRVRLQGLQRQVAADQARTLQTTAAGSALQSRVDRLGIDAGTVLTRGPGIEVRVDDAPGATSYKQTVQARDLQKLVNGLWEVGAEAVSVNGQRIAGLTSIREAAGSVTVNYVSLRRPYTLLAVGNPKNLAARLLDTTGGQTWIALHSTFQLKFDIENKDAMVLPAVRLPALRFAHERVAR